MAAGPVNLTTDSGLADACVAAMGAFLAVNPDATTVDITHEVRTPA